MRYVFCLVMLAVLAGCAHNQPVAPARTAVPVECKEVVAERPTMPTEGLAEDAGLDAYVQAAAAEIKFREGYEVKLRTSLEACVAPVVVVP